MRGHGTGHSLLSVRTGCVCDRPGRQPPCRRLGDERIAQTPLIVMVWAARAQTHAALAHADPGPQGGPDCLMGRKGGEGMVWPPPPRNCISPGLISIDLADLAVAWRMRDGERIKPSWFGCLLCAVKTDDANHMQEEPQNAEHTKHKGGNYRPNPICSSLEMLPDAERWGSP